MGPFALVAAVAIAPVVITACGGDPSEAPRGTQSSAVIATGSPTSTTTVINPGGGGYAPIVMYPATLFGGVATDHSVTLDWSEHGGNASTILYRQLYDLAGNATTGWVQIGRWNGAPAGTMTFTDDNATQAVSKSVSTNPSANGGPILPDHQIAYKITEVASGYSDCESLPNGQTCANTTTMVYTPKSIPYGVGRAQLRVKIASTSGDTTYFHLRAKLNFGNETWLDLSGRDDDFAAGSNNTFELMTNIVDGLQDVNYINLWTPDAEGICVSEISLALDNTTAFTQTFPICQWVKNGGQLNVPFGTIRSSVAWANYAPRRLFLDSVQSTFVGFDASDFLTYLDAAVGTQLKSSLEAGPRARMRAAAESSWTDAMHLHVTQHLADLKAGDYGYELADPEYDLVIHHHENIPQCAYEDWCLTVENVNVNAGYSGGIEDVFLDVVTLGAASYIEHQTNNALASKLEDFHSTLPTQTFAWCFTAPTNEATNFSPLVTTFYSDGQPFPFDAGSFTVCTIHP